MGIISSRSLSRLLSGIVAALRLLLHHRVIANFIAYTSTQLCRVPRLARRKRLVGVLGVDLLSGDLLVDFAHAVGLQ
jgi:hypothetical protein